MEKILVALIAIKQAIKQYHWQTNSYQTHILADKLEEGLEDYIDEVAELSVLTQPNDRHLEAKNLLEKSSNFLTKVGYLQLIDILELFGKLQDAITTYNDTTEDIGLKDLCGRLSNTLLRKAYLIQLQINSK